jgi:hypothetical protein
VVNRIRAVVTVEVVNRIRAAVIVEVIDRIRAAVIVEVIDRIRAAVIMEGRVMARIVIDRHRVGRDLIDGEHVRWYQPRAGRRGGWGPSTMAAGERWRHVNIGVNLGHR